MFYVSFVLNITKHKAFRRIFLYIARKHFQKASGMLSLNPYNFSGFRHSFWSQQNKNEIFYRLNVVVGGKQKHFGIISYFVLEQIIAHNRKKYVLFSWISICIVI